MPPFIPRGQEDQVINVSEHPQEAVDVTRAGLQDRAMQKFGEGVSEFGQGLAEYSKKRREISKKIDVDNFKAEMESIALDQHAQAIRSASADGSDINQKFNEKYDDAYKDRLSQITDPDAMREARAKAIEIRNVMNKDLYEKSQAMFVDYGLTNSRRLRAQVTAGVFGNPDNLGEYSQRGYDYMKSLAPILGADNLRKEILAFESDIADNHINGLVNQNRYDDARKALVSQWAGQYQGEKRQEKMDYIDKQQMQNIDRSRGTIRFNQEQDKLKLEEKQKNNFRDLYTRQQNGEDVEEEAARLEGLGLMSNPGRAVLTGLKDKDELATSQYSKYNFHGQALILGRPIPLVMTDVGKAVADKKMKPSDGAETLDFLYHLQESQKDKRFSDPAFKALERDYRKRISTRFGVDLDNPLLGSTFGNGKNMEMAAAALTEFSQYVYLHDGYSSPRGLGEAYKIVMKNKGGYVETTSDVDNIPGLDRNSYEDPKAVDAAKRALQNNHRSGKLPSKDYLKNLQKLDDLKRINDAKAQAKGGSNWVDFMSGSEGKE